VQRTDGEIVIMLNLDVAEADLVMNVSPASPPQDVVIFSCPEDTPPATPPLMLGWSSLVLTHMDDLGESGFQIRGPWQAGPSGSSLVASTSYTAQWSEDDMTATAQVKVELRRR
jgi:hypothetical protein